MKIHQNDYGTFMFSKSKVKCLKKFGTKTGPGQKFKGPLYFQTYTVCPKPNLSVQIQRHGILPSWFKCKATLATITSCKKLRGRSDRAFMISEWNPINRSINPKPNDPPFLLLCPPHQPCSPKWAAPCLSGLI